METKNQLDQSSKLVFKRVSPSDTSDITSIIQLKSTVKPTVLQY